MTIKVRRAHVPCMQETVAHAHTWPKDQARARNDRVSCIQACARLVKTVFELLSY